MTSELFSVEIVTDCDGAKFPVAFQSRIWHILHKIVVGIVELKPKQLFSTQSHICTCQSSDSRCDISVNFKSSSASVTLLPYFLTTNTGVLTVPSHKNDSYVCADMAGC